MNRAEGAPNHEPQPHHLNLNLSPSSAAPCAAAPWAILTLANWNGNSAKTLSVALADIPGLPPAPAYAAFEFKTQTFLGIYKPADTISHAIPAHGARVIRLTPLTKNNATYLIGTDLNMSNGMEIAAIDGTRATLRPELREFPATLTFLEYKNGKATITKTSTTPHRPTKSTPID